MHDRPAPAALNRPARLALLAAAAWLLAAAATALPYQSGRAPDGRPGFGAEARIKDVRGMFQSPAAEEQAFLAGLQGLEGEIGVLLARFAKGCEERGDFALLERRVEPTLVNLRAAWLERMADPLPALVEGAGRGEVFAHLCSDLRFRARARLCAGLAYELRELNGSLALLRAHFAGYADLKDIEVAQLGRRADLAAARLRALRLDLDALRDDEPPDAQALETLIGLARGRVDPGRAAEVLEQLAERERQMLALLFTERLSREIAAELEWRARQRKTAERILAEARALSPESGEADVPDDVRRMSKSKRHEAAGLAALQGLSFDLLDEELNWLAAVSIDFQWGPPESRRWFDRFLALRGIRAHEARSYEYGRLDERERHALARVQLPPPEPPR